MRKVENIKLMKKIIFIEILIFKTKTKCIGSRKRNFVFNYLYIYKSKNYYKMPIKLFESKNLQSYFRIQSPKVINHVLRTDLKSFSLELCI